MNFAQLELVRDTATAVLWRIEQLVDQGKPFETAKREAIKQAEPSWRGFSKEIADGVRNVSWSLTYADMHKDVRARRTCAFLEDVEKFRGKTAGPIERAFFHLTGLVFWV